MGSLSFGVSEIFKSPVNGWFKLLTQVHNLVTACLYIEIPEEENNN